MSDLWISGGYVNAIVTIPVKSNGGKQHMINFVVDDNAQKDSTYTFMFRHNAFGEVLASDSSKNKDMVLANGYVSFPISSIIKEDAANIVIKWNSYKVLDPGIVSSSSEEYKIDRTYSKNTFEQVPSSAKSTVMAMSIE